MASPQPQHQQGYQSPPVQPDQAYQPANNNGDYIQPVQEQQQQQQPLPPSYDQAKAATMGQPPQGYTTGQPPATVIPLNMLGPEPQWIDCPFCHQRTKTMINKEGSSMQIIVGAVLCFVCVCLTCLPCILGWFEDIEYRCSHCKNMVAVKRNDAPIEVYGPQVPVYSQYAGQPQPMDYGQPQQHEQQTKGVQSPGPHDQQQYQQPQEQQYQQHPQQQFEHSQQQQQQQQQYQQPQQYQQHEMQNMQPQQPSPAASPYAQK